MAAARRAVVDRGGRLPANSTSPAVASVARSVSAMAVRITWQCVWSQRSNPSARCLPRFAAVYVRTAMASASSAAGAVFGAASPASTRAT